MSAPAQICAPHFDRANRSVPSVIVIAGEGMCGPCFEGKPIHPAEKEMRANFRAISEKILLRCRKRMLRRALGSGALMSVASAAHALNARPAVVRMMIAAGTLERVYFRRAITVRAADVAKLLRAKLEG